MKLITFTSLLLVLWACTPSEQKIDIPNTESTQISLGFLEAPSGFSIEEFSDQVPGARQLAVSPSGVVYVGTRRTGEDGKVYAVVDSDNDFKADTVYTIISGLRMPNGVAFKDGNLYVAEISNIWRFEDIESDLGNPPEPVLVRDDYPRETSHGWKYIDFGPDGKLYVPVGAPCNICNNEEENPIFASLTRMNTDGSNREIIAYGIRNTVGFTWHPETQNIWFTDNGRDWLGDDTPPGELNELTEEGQHFGFPFLHASSVWDPEFGDAGRDRENEFRKPVQELGPHVAPLGLIFYTGEMFPSSYQNQALIAEHGSWNRSEKIGYRITFVTFDDEGNPTSYKPFITGWLQSEEDIRGRPVSIVQLQDGSILISDDHSGKIYRVTYQP
ncbi:MAG: sorbosone dehydrogenase family protein [Balneolaceae bacterium]|nr:sorbosone dehydrogenase family protein [Balneolaceae bacterium]MBO6544979.1 sorbosone dehydrogenase family protein [Balneolaceae bacterium]MBO6646375.1 sorbosone dehydrogenase family protein [Balneolaceae bacterium]